jgi:hypothetical protein
LVNIQPFEIQRSKTRQDWRETQIEFGYNKFFNDFILFQPLIGLRELKEEYRRIGNGPSIPSLNSMIMPKRKVNLILFNLGLVSNLVFLNLLF